MKHHRTIRIGIFVAAMLALSACAGVPFSTLWHFRNFGPKDFLRTDPAAVRAALQLDDGVSLGNTPPALNVTLKFKNEPQQKFEMPLEVLKEGPWVGAGTEGAEKGKHWYLLALSDKGVVRYRDLQAAIAGHLDAAGRFRQHGSLGISMQTNQLQFSGAEIERLRKNHRMFMQARLELSRKNGFYTLYKGEFKVSPDMTKEAPGSG